jgi:hypothetical protein
MQHLLYKKCAFYFAIYLILMVIFLMLLWKHDGDRVLNQPLKPMLLHIRSVKGLRSSRRLGGAKSANKA